MKVTLLSGNALYGMVENAVLGALTCTGNEKRVKKYDPVKFLMGLVERGHESVIEHINLTFRVEGISRALLQELARHRHISLSVRSTRYTLTKELEGDKRNEAMSEEIGNILLTAASKYGPDAVEKLQDAAPEEITSLFLMKLRGKGVPRYTDLMKYFLPEFFPTSLVMTANARALRHIFKVRSAPEALHEFRCLTKALYDAIPEDYRGLFKDCMHED